MAEIIKCVCKYVDGISQLWLFFITLLIIEEISLEEIQKLPRHPAHLKKYEKYRKKQVLLSIWTSHTDFIFLQ